MSLYMDSSIGAKPHESNTVTGVNWDCRPVCRCESVSYRITQELYDDLKKLIDSGDVKCHTIDHALAFRHIHGDAVATIKPVS